MTKTPSHQQTALGWMRCHLQCHLCTGNRVNLETYPEEHQIWQQICCYVCFPAKPAWFCLLTISAPRLEWCCSFQNARSSWAMYDPHMGSQVTQLIYQLILIAHSWNSQRDWVCPPKAIPESSASTRKTKRISTLALLSGIVLGGQTQSLREFQEWAIALAY